MPTLASNTQLHLVRLLQVLFQQQARDILSRMTLEDVEAGRVPETTHWIRQIAQAVNPIMTQYFQTGLIRSNRRIQALLSGRKPIEEEIRQVSIPLKGVSTYGQERGESPSRLMPMPCLYVDKAVCDYRRWGRPYVKKASAPMNLAFDLFNPKILDAVDAATMQFCRETNETATAELTVAIRRLRRALKQGLEQGAATAELTRKIRQIFASPQRAWAIATTESSRAIHQGELLSARESGVVGGKEWLASSDACPACLKLNGVQKKIDEPFYVDPKGGTYAVVQCPPLHPHCFCTLTEILGDPKKPIATATPIPLGRADKPAPVPPLLIPEGTREGTITRPVMPIANFAEAFNNAFTRLDKGDNFISLAALRSALPEFTAAQFDAGINDMQRRNLFYLRAAEGRGGVSEQDRVAGIKIGDQLYNHVSRR